MSEHVNHKINFSGLMVTTKKLYKKNFHVKMSYYVNDLN